eukprot:Colp12_sorted_trinity150504_noHs@35658
MVDLQDVFIRKSGRHKKLKEDEATTVFPSIQERVWGQYTDEVGKALMEAIPLGWTLLGSCEEECIYECHTHTHTPDYLLITPEGEKVVIDARFPGKLWLTEEDLKKIAVVKFCAAAEAGIIFLPEGGKVAAELSEVARTLNIAVVCMTRDNLIPYHMRTTIMDLHEDAQKNGVTIPVSITGAKYYQGGQLLPNGERATVGGVLYYKPGRHFACGERLYEEYYHYLEKSSIFYGGGSVLPGRGISLQGGVIMYRPAPPHLMSHRYFDIRRLKISASAKKTVKLPSMFSGKSKGTAGRRSTREPGVPPPRTRKPAKLVAIGTPIDKTRPKQLVYYVKNNFKDIFMPSVLPVAQTEEDHERGWVRTEELSTSKKAATRAAPKVRKEKVDVFYKDGKFLPELAKSYVKSALIDNGMPSKKKLSKAPRTPKKQEKSAGSARKKERTVHEKLYGYDSDDLSSEDSEYALQERVSSGFW